jgi:hypothetical protein
VLIIKSSKNNTAIIEKANALKPMPDKMTAELL